jgi:DNA-binding MarR family transcriptional regulator
MQSKHYFQSAMVDLNTPGGHAGEMLRSFPAKSAPPSDDGDIGGIDQIVGFHIRLAYGAVYRHFTETFNDLGLTQKQVSVLWLIDDHPGIAQADIGRRLQMDRATVMAIINRLQKRGFVVRGPSPDDRRRQTLKLTEAGHDGLIAARACILDHEQWLKNRFTPGETAMLIELLRRIHE